MTSISWNARVLSWRLGLGDLQRSEVCHGYQNGCICSNGCLERAKRPNSAPEPVKQPWEVEAA